MHRRTSLCKCSPSYININTVYTTKKNTDTFLTIYTKPKPKIQSTKKPYIRGLIKKGLQFILKGSIRSTINNIVRDRIPQEGYVNKTLITGVSSLTLSNCTYSSYRMLLLHTTKANQTPPTSEQCGGATSHSCRN